MKKTIMIGMIMLMILASVTLVAAVTGPTMTRTVTPSYGPSGQIFTIRLTAAKAGTTEDMAGIISEVKPSSFTFYDQGNWIGTFDSQAVSVDGDNLDLAFTESSSSGYFEYKLANSSISGVILGNVTWAGNVTTDLGATNLTVCIDNDGDKYNSTGGVCGVIDCNDNNSSIHPGASDSNCNNIDENCNVVADEGYVANTSCFLPGVCAAGNAASSCTAGVETACRTGTPTNETCDNLDNNCNGKIDENLTIPTTCGVGQCSGNTGLQTCTAGVFGNNTCNPFAGATNETCDNIDNNCNGLTDENLLRHTLNQNGLCSGNNETCSAGVWSAFGGNYLPTDEICDNKDNNCDGTKDENLGTSFCGVGICNHTIQNCVNGQNQTCNPFQGAKAEICNNKIDEDCDGSDLACDITVNMPLLPSYDDKKIPINITLSGSMEFVKYMDMSRKNPMGITLCRNCMDYGNKAKKTLTFGDGNHTIVFFGTRDDDVVVNETVTFFVDDKSPVLKTQESLKDDYCNGSFSVRYNELFLKKATLFYGSDKLEKEDCVSGNNEECIFDVNISPYEGQEISYYFEVSDLFRDVAFRKNKTCIVDNTAPSFVSINSPAEGLKYNKSIPFKIQLDEVSKLSYSDNGGRFSTLCARCDSYGVSSKKSKTFRAGNHTVTFMAVDKAENQRTETVTFEVI